MDVQHEKISTEQEGVETFCCLIFFRGVGVSWVGLIITRGVGTRGGISAKCRDFIPAPPASSPEVDPTEIFGGPRGTSSSDRPLQDCYCRGM